MDGGLAVIADKKIPNRATPIVPPGAQSLRHMTGALARLPALRVGVSFGVLRPSTALTTFMQPVASYELGYCRPECTKCSEVCPTGQRS